MLVLFTDFGADDIYVGQLKAALHAVVPTVPVVDLLHRVPNFNIVAGAHLLAALRSSFPPEAVFLAVVDPGVGSTRGAVVVRANAQWFVGPDNGLLSVAAARASDSAYWRIDWRPNGLSASFHGRDWFAPIAAQIASGDFPEDKLLPVPGLKVCLDDADPQEIIYVDHYGNALTGLRSGNVPHSSTLEIEGSTISYARVFSEVPHGEAFWYDNSIGLIEIAVNRGNAMQALGLSVGTSLQVSRQTG
jgi:S-adenosyl-L-methionine hydrolase (adenosine-forming)